jgi:SAM-dependent methyltransferase
MTQATPTTFSQDACLQGESLWGDDFAEAEVAAWFESERSAYREIHETSLAQGRGDEARPYEAVDQRLGWDALPPGPVGDVLALGGYDGSDVEPIRERISSLWVIDPAFPPGTELRDGLPITTVAPRQDGRIDAPDGRFDVVLSFSVLHHIPNVSAVLRELARVLSPGGHLLLREPVISMGDWRRPRPGLTARERGLPLPWLRARLAELPFDVQRERLWCVNGVRTIAERFGVRGWYQHDAAVTLDLMLARLLEGNYRYHRVRLWQKLAPTSIYLVLTRRES